MKKNTLIHISLGLSIASIIFTTFSLVSIDKAIKETTEVVSSQTLFEPQTSDSYYTKETIHKNLPTTPSPVDLLAQSLSYTHNWDKDCHDSTIQLTYEDAQVLMRIAQAEAGIDGVEGMAAVMKTILNRVESSKFPDSVEAVVTQYATLPDGRVVYQFSPIDIGTYDTVEISADSHIALAEIEKGTYAYIDALYFENAENSWQEQNCEYLYTIGHHRFYK